MSGLLSRLDCGIYFRGGGFIAHTQTHLSGSQNLPQNLEAFLCKLLPNVKPGFAHFIDLFPPCHILNPFRPEFLQAGSAQPMSAFYSCKLPWILTTAVAFTELLFFRHGSSSLALSFDAEVDGQTIRHIQPKRLLTSHEP